MEKVGREVCPEGNYLLLLEPGTVPERALERIGSDRICPTFDII